ncbi:hypothetical protein SK128_015164, partial [Halocaridina rubra]
GTPFFQVSSFYCSSISSSTHPPNIHDEVPLIFITSPLVIASPTWSVSWRAKYYVGHISRLIPTPLPQ